MVCFWGGTPFSATNERQENAWKTFCNDKSGTEMTQLAFNPTMVEKYFIILQRLHAVPTGHKEKVERMEKWTDNTKPNQRWSFTQGFWLLPFLSYLHKLQMLGFEQFGWAESQNKCQTVDLEWKMSLLETSLW